MAGTGSRSVHHRRERKGTGHEARIVGAGATPCCTDIDLNGYVSRRGREVEVKTPFNDAIADLVNSFPVGTRKPEMKNIEPLVRMPPR